MASDHPTPCTWCRLFASRADWKKLKVLPRWEMLKQMHISLRSEFRGQKLVWKGPGVYHQCCDCYKWQPLEQFHARDYIGHQPFCIECRKELKK